jgi:hypothetical protein
MLTNSTQKVTSPYSLQVGTAAQQLQKLKATRLLVNNLKSKITQNRPSKLSSEPRQKSLEAGQRVAQVKETQ